MKQNYRTVTMESLVAAIAISLIRVPANSEIPINILYSITLFWETVSYFCIFSAIGFLIRTPSDIVSDLAILILSNSFHSGKLGRFAGHPIALFHISYLLSGLWALSIFVYH